MYNRYVLLAIILIQTLGASVVGARGVGRLFVLTRHIPVR